MFKSIKNKLRDNFNFTISESESVIVLFSVILICVVSLVIYKSYLKENKLEVILEELEGDSVIQKNNTFFKDQDIIHNEAPIFEITYSDFDPNTASKEELLKNGISAFAVNNILKYRAKNGKYKVPYDLQKTYGISEQQFQTLLPYIKIKSNLNLEKHLTEDQKKLASQFEEKSVITEVLDFDINTADTSHLKKIPGIGSVYSRRIIKFRDLLGGFHSLEQIHDTHGLSPELAQKVIEKSRIIKKPKLININKDDFHHFYIKKHQKSAIIKYRKQHGDFGKKSDLKNVYAISDDDFNRIAPYLDLP